jgi:RHH-type transcriptional regulator, proline utilization regulon repressor / proline dehydrogenase / delta 1-pyrroline-5-carboxylate dehydrogenase
MLEQKVIDIPSGLRKRINDAYRKSELSCLEDLIEYAQLNQTQLNSIQTRAKQLVTHLRTMRYESTSIDSFLAEYALSSQEGIALMCLAEALLRIPDKKTADKLIQDKLTNISAQARETQSHSFLIHSTTWALMLTGKILNPERAESILTKGLMSFVRRSSEALIRKALSHAMYFLGDHFVIGGTIDDALMRARKKEDLGYRYSYDMLGEAALTADDAKRYFEAYAEAIKAIGSAQDKSLDVYVKPGISIKLSALHPRYQEAQRDRVLEELSVQLLYLAELAKSYNIAMTIDAEESERLDLSLDVIERVFAHQSLAEWNGFGIAVQSYQKRAFYVLDWLADLARRHHRRIMVRLIKGAYWDTEIKKTQMQGLDEYPVFTRKCFTDVSFQACAKKLLTMQDVIYPQFATHNAYSVALILELMGENKDFEFQCLHGMGDELYAQIVPASYENVPCRIYAPVGTYQDLLPYLVRRLLENGANSSFVNRMVDEKVPIESLIEDPVEKSRTLLPKINTNIPLPYDIFKRSGRCNSRGLDWTDRQVRASMQKILASYENFSWRVGPLLGKGLDVQRDVRDCFSPFDKNRSIGRVEEASLEDVALACHVAQEGFASWSVTKVKDRANILRMFADKLYTHQSELLALLCLEAGKTWSDSLSEIREAIDFCHYYANEAEQLMSEPKVFYGYTGESNCLSFHPRGVVICISPWNFPLAIFVGQVVAALVTGNVVIAKPAEQTPMIAHLATCLLREAGVPYEALQLLPGRGETIGAALVQDPRVKAVIFTGSTQTATCIHQSLAHRGGEIIPLIAETGGQNCMIVDSSALLEQVTIDVLTSAFGSAGQRCSALRVLFVQEEIYPRMLMLLKGAMAELRVGDPRWLSTDVGPVIDQEALQHLERHVQHMKDKHELIYACQPPSDVSGYFLPPIAFAIDRLDVLTQEIFGPVLHVIRYREKDLDDVIRQINATGYGLTLGIHSRVNHTIQYIHERVRAGNCYVNRNMIGAVVGLQPFGGEGLSGTGPKAGGPLYLQRLCYERTLTIDTTAAGGNASLMAIPEV